MTEWFGGVASLFQRTKHEVGKDALLRLAGDFANQSLVMLRRDVDVFRRKGYAHGALAPMSVGIRAAGFGGGGNAAVAHGNFALMQIFDAKRITKGASELLELQDLARVRLFVNAVKR